MHVGICFEFAALNGGENSMLALMPLLRDRGVRITAIAPSHGPLADRLAEMRIDVVPWRSGDEQMPSLPQRRHQLRQAIATCSPDLIHGNSLNISRLLGPVVGQLGMPSVGHLRDIIKLSAQAIRDLSTHRRLLAVSKATKTFHVEQGLPAAQTAVLYNGVDVDRFRPHEATGYLQRELGLMDTAVLVGGIGQLGLRKGWRNALEGFRTAIKCHPDMHFLLVGEQNSTKAETLEYVAELRRMASQGDLAGRVHFLGRRHDVPRILNELAILIHPARQEPLGRVLLEAAASGTAIIATKIGGTPEIFPATSKAARLVPVDAPDSIAAQVAELIRDPDARRSLGQNAREEMRRFRLGPCGEALYGYYLDALKRTPGGD